MAHDQPDLSQKPDIRPAYRAFLLRCWQERMDGGFAWRFTLVQLGGGRVQRGFARLEDVSAYLQESLATVSSSDQANIANGLSNR